MKKGRHRRFEEARALKRAPEVVVEPCAECGADPEDDHASWCLASEDDEDPTTHRLGDEMTGAEGIVQRLEIVEEELSDLAMSKLREGIESGDASAVADEKRLTRARRSVEKAMQHLSG